MVAESTIESDTADSLRKNVFEGITFICSLSKKKHDFRLWQCFRDFYKTLVHLFGNKFFSYFFLFFVIISSYFHRCNVKNIHFFSKCILQTPKREENSSSIMPVINSNCSNHAISCHIMI